MKHIKTLTAFAMAMAFISMNLPASAVVKPRLRRFPSEHIQNPPAHDPVMIQVDSIYYMFSTGRNVQVMSSTDMTYWNFEPPVFEEAPQWALQTVPGYNGHTWAPDVLFYHGQYHLFYSCSSFGKNTSAIGHAVCDTLKRNEPSKWRDTGVVIRSASGITDWNAIDPNVIIDENGTPWMTFGSFWGGIQLVQLNDSLTALADVEAREAVASGKTSPATKHLASRFDWQKDGKRTQDNAIEAPFMFRHGDYYYLLVSWDYCCKGDDSTYRVVVGRSKSVAGPFLDKDGKPMTQGGGTLLVFQNDKYIASGHCSAYHFQEQDYFVCHGYRRDNGMSELIIRPIKWDSEGWPEVSL